MLASPKAHTYYIEAQRQIDFIFDTILNLKESQYEQLNQVDYCIYCLNNIVVKDSKVESAKDKLKENLKELSILIKIESSNVENERKNTINSLLDLKKALIEVER